MKKREKNNSRFAGTKFIPLILAIDPKSGMYLKKSIKDKESPQIQFLFLTSSLVLVSRCSTYIEDSPLFLVVKSTATETSVTKIFPPNSFPSFSMKLCIKPST